MPDFKLITVEERPYYYVERSCSMDPEDVGNAMVAAFQDVWDHMQQNDVSGTGKALSVYYTYDPHHLTFRSGFTVASEASAKASKDVRYDVTPAGQVLHFQHAGSYSKLRESYGVMMAYCEENDLKIGAPTWEVYLNDPAITAEDDLLTDIFVSLAA